MMGRVGGVGGRLVGFLDFLVKKRKEREEKSRMMEAGNHGRWLGEKKSIAVWKH